MRTRPIALSILTMASVLSCLRFGAAPVALADLPPTAPAMHPEPSLEAPPPAPPPAKPKEVVRVEPTRLWAESALTHLKVKGFGDAAVSLPLGTTRPRPIVVAVHGQNSRAEWMCWMAQHVVGARAFVVCPRGARTRGNSDDAVDARFTFGTSEAIEKEIDAAVAALRREYPAFVDPGPMVFFGHSYGAILGASVATKNPVKYPRVLLSEGGHAELGAWVAHEYGAHGGHRVLFACGTVTCLQGAKLAVARFSGSKAHTQLAYAKDGGHYLYGRLADAIGGAFDWLVEGDPRFLSER